MNDIILTNRILINLVDSSAKKYSKFRHWVSCRVLLDLSVNETLITTSEINHDEA